MKTGIFFLLMATLSPIMVNAQTIPFGYPKSGLTILPSSSEMVKDNITSTDKTKLPITSGQQKSRNELYLGVAAHFKNKADELNKVINANYQAELEKLQVTAIDIRQFDTEVQQLNQIRSLRMAEVEMLKNSEKAYNYLAKTIDTLRWFPVRNAVSAEIYYNGSLSDDRNRFINNSLLTISTDGGKASIFNELYADYFGPFRIGFGVLISNKQASPSPSSPDEKQSDAVQRLLGGGGNGSISLSYPILSYQGDSDFFMKLTLSPKFNIDVPKLGTDNSKYANNLNTGMEGSLYYTGMLKVFTLFTNFRFAQLSGNKEFYANLEKADEKSFKFHQVTLGIALSSAFRISYTHYFGSSFVKTTFPSAISFSIIPH